MCGIPAKKSRDRLDNGLLIDVPGIPPVQFRLKQDTLSLVFAFGEPYDIGKKLHNDREPPVIREIPVTQDKRREEYHDEHVVVS